MWTQCLLGLVLLLQTQIAFAAQINLSWSDNSTNEDTLLLERKTGLQGSFSQIQSFAPNTTSFKDTSLTAGQLYCFRIRAHNTTGDSAYSNQVCNIAKDFAPLISITTPVQDAQVSSTVVIQANTSGQATVAGVQFKINGSNFGSEDTSSPYSISWDTTTGIDGFYTLMAVARDSSGNLTESVPVTVTVNNFATPPPTANKILAYSFDSGVSPVTDASGNGFTGTVTQAYWVPGTFNLGLQFDGQAANVTSTLTANGTIRTYSLSTYRMGPGGYGFGRILSKSSASGEVELLENDDANAVYRYIRVWDGTIGSWTIPQPSANVWHHIGVIYDASSTANKPTIYLDGVAQTVSTTSTPVGSIVSNTDPYILGNSASGDRGWNGLIDNLYIYNAALTQAQIQATMNTGVQ